MKLELIIGIIIVSVIVLGFVIGAIIPETNEGCTEIGCRCEGVSGERSCNSCSFSDHIFTTGILNVVQQCRASEIIICGNDAQVDSRIDLANKKCTTDWYVFGFNLRYLGTNPEKTVSNTNVNKIVTSIDGNKGPEGGIHNLPRGCYVMKKRIAEEFDCFGCVGNFCKDEDLQIWDYIGQDIAAEKGHVCIESEEKGCTLG